MSNCSPSGFYDFRLVLLGDSDIDRWPKVLLPSVGQKETTVSGHRGATLSQVLAYAPETEKTVLVVCAGENDVGCVPLWESEQALDALLERTVQRYEDVNLIFLGPKLEPWLADDPDARKSYIQMSRTFQRRVEREDRATFLDILTLFCSDRGQPGALLKAVPDPCYFDADGLHLSDEGYQKWKELVEQTVGELQLYTRDEMDG